MTERMSVTKRRGVMVRAARPTPISLGGRTINLKVTLYDNGPNEQHSAINTVPATKELMCDDDLELVSEFTLFVRKLRTQTGGNNNG